MYKQKRYVLRKVSESVHTHLCNSESHAHQTVPNNKYIYVHIYVNMYMYAVSKWMKVYDTD